MRREQFIRVSAFLQRDLDVQPDERHDLRRVRRSDAKSPMVGSPWALKRIFRKRTFSLREFGLCSIFVPLSGQRGGRPMSGCVRTRSSACCPPRPVDGGQAGGAAQESRAGDADRPLPQRGLVDLGNRSSGRPDQRRMRAVVQEISQSARPIRPPSFSPCRSAVSTRRCSYPTARCRAPTSVRSIAWCRIVRELDRYHGFTGREVPCARPRRSVGADARASGASRRVG